MTGVIIGLYGKAMTVFGKAEFQIHFVLQGIPQRMSHGQNAFRPIEGRYLADDITVIFQTV